MAVRDYWLLVVRMKDGTWGEVGGQTDIGEKGRGWVAKPTRGNWVIVVEYQNKQSVSVPTRTGDLYNDPYRIDPHSWIF